jgi:2-aminoethylphosphonate-pyruvate transaminase
MLNPLPIILLNPGPVNLSSGVREALMKSDICHREAEFALVQDTLRKKILAVYNLSSEHWASILLAGSGTAAVEAMLSSLIPKNGKILVIENGVYGERMTQICKVHDIACTTVKLIWGDQIDLSAVENSLDTERQITHLAVVHHETTTGRLNALQELNQLCQRRGVIPLVDGVSSFGAEAIDFDRIGACAATSNKCIHGVPGVSFVIVRRELLSDTRDYKRSLYLDLNSYCRQQDAHSTPFTQPTHVYYALDQALTELSQAGGWRSRHRHYRTLAHQVRSGLAKLGIHPLLDSDASSVVLTAYYLPEKMDYKTLHDELKVQGFVIYAGQGRLEHNIFRISTMGEINPQDIERLLLAFRNILGTL